MTETRVNLFGPDEADLAIERLLIEKNGRRKTVSDVFEVLIAMHHASQHRDSMIVERIENHADTYVHYTPEQLEHVFSDLDDKVCGQVEKLTAFLRADIAALRQLCAEQSVLDEEKQNWYQILFAWKTLRWGVAAAIIVGLNVIGDLIAGV